jgi:hypothetical protein
MTQIGAPIFRPFLRRAGRFHNRGPSNVVSLNKHQQAASMREQKGSCMSQSISRFILNDDGSIIDIAQRLPPESACKCDR